jgi:aspartyl-tRNA(Asn)/glutamyl-tRNA(Gln) amidotransferase subunit A
VSAAVWEQSIDELAPQIRSGALSPVALTKASLERIAEHDDKLKSFIHIADDALAQARKAQQHIQRGKWRGPLHGVPIAIKDNYLTADMPTTVGTTAPGLEYPLRDSAAVARLRAAGAVLIGKTRTHEFAWGNVTPPVRNPWDRTPAVRSGCRRPRAALSGSSRPLAASAATGSCRTAGRSIMPARSRAR